MTAAHDRSEELALLAGRATGLSGPLTQSLCQRVSGCLRGCI